MEYDEQFDVLIDPDTGLVHDPESGEPLATFEDFYGLNDDDDDESDELLFGGLSPDEISAVSQAVGENYRTEMGALKDEIAALQQERAADAGYQYARAEDAAELAAAEQDESDWQASLDSLANKLNRPISELESSRIEALLPDEYNDSDVERAAQDAGITSFTARGAKGRQARAAYLTSRISEIETAADENYRAGGFDPVEDSGGLSALIASAEANGGN